MELTILMTKISIRFFNDREVRAAWDESSSQWFFAAVDIVAVLNEQSDYTRNRNYWKYLKNKLKQENPQLVSAANQLKLTAPDGKKRLTDCFDSSGVIELAKNFPNTKASKFLDWFLYSDNTIDGQSKKKAYALFESGLLSTLEPGTVKCLQQIHSYIFGGSMTLPVRSVPKTSAKAVSLSPTLFISTLFCLTLKICLNPPLRKSSTNTLK